MQITQVFKSLICFFTIIAVLFFSPNALFSQDAKSTSKPPTSAGSSLQRALTLPPRSQEPAGTQGKTGPQAKTATAVYSDTQFPLDPVRRPSLITQAVSLTLLSLLPFIIMILTSFLKIVIVLSLLRSALGVQQAPPNQIINGVAFMLSLFIMYPTVLLMYDAAEKVMAKTKAPDSLIASESSAYIIAIASEAREPLRLFLKRNSSIAHQALFYRLSYRILPEDHRANLKPDDFMVIVPSYITSQLKDAFEIGVLIYIPFFVIDLVTSNILLAMGMMMLSPVTISMPLKLFLLVMLDGWTLLIEGLVNTFR
jgi:type III secretion protein R